MSFFYVFAQDESYAFTKKWLYGRELLEYREAWDQAKVRLGGVTQYTSRTHGWMDGWMDGSAPWRMFFGTPDFIGVKILLAYHLVSLPTRRACG